ncbi:MAG: hypothetical protein M3036_12515 [Bifidobacteriales bacterium]|nr:hypothetical protein [Bifidobacteriales bacterium]
MTNQDPGKNFLKSLEGFEADLDQTKYPATRSFISGIIARVKLQQSGQASALTLETVITDTAQTLYFMETRLNTVENRDES